MIKVGDVVRTIEPIDGWIYGGIVMKKDETTGYCGIRSGKDFITVSESNLVKSIGMAEAISRLEECYFRMLQDGNYSSTSEESNVPSELISHVGRVARLARYPLGIPKSRPLVIETDGSDAADDWKK